MSAPDWALAYLSGAVRPGSVEMWAVTEAHGPEKTIAYLGAESSLARREGERHLAAGHAVGVRLVSPAAEEWPAEALEPLQRLACDAAGGLRSGAHAGREGPGALAPPLGLWIRGGGPLPDMPRSVAIVGTRAATDYGEHVAREIGFGLAEQGIVVVSGGAYGIDAAAHRGALAAGGRSLAVLAGGADVAYPRGNARLLDAIADTGWVLSERPPGAPVGRELFLVRNRLIAALACSVVVVEAPARSGALATARRAALMGRQLLAVPGPVTSAASVGCHLLMREYAATVVTCAAEVMEAVGPVGEFLAPVPRGPVTVRDGLSVEQRRLLDALHMSRPMRAEPLARGVGMRVADVRRCLAPLVARGLVAVTGRGYVLASARGSDEVVTDQDLPPGGLP